MTCLAFSCVSRNYTWVPVPANCSYPYAVTRLEARSVRETIGVRMQQYLECVRPRLIDVFWLRVVIGGIAMIRLQFVRSDWAQLVFLWHMRCMEHSGW